MRKMLKRGEITHEEIEEMVMDSVDKSHYQKE